MFSEVNENEIMFCHDDDFHQDAAHMFKAIVVPNSAESAARFANSRKRDLDGLVAQGVFTIQK